MSLTAKFGLFLRKPLHDKLNVLQNLVYRIKAVIYYRRVFGTFGSRTLLLKPLLLSNPRFIHLGNDVLIRQGVRMEIVVAKGRIPMMRIGNNVNIEQNVHLVCHSRLIIGDNVSITGHCAIVDVIHPYTDTNNLTKIGDRILDDDSFVEIGDGSFLGFGSLVMPNVRVGRYCVIGAHAVVTKDLPDYSVVAGNPAKLIRRYDEEKGEWISAL